MNLLIWGSTRELLAGGLPPGVPAVEATSLAEVRAKLDVRGSLVLADVAHLKAEEQAVEGWLRNGGSGVILIGLAPAGEADALLDQFPFLHDVLQSPVTPGRLRLRLERSFDVLHSRRVIQQLDSALERKNRDLHEVNKIGVALSAQRDIDKLLQLILAKSREITAADAGSLYLVVHGDEQESTEGDHLRFELSQNDSVLVPFEKYSVPLDETSIAGYVALTGRIVNVADAYNLPEGSPYKVSRSFDQKSGYRTKSMLVVPMRDHQDEVIGVVQLINKKHDSKVILRPVSLVEASVTSFTAVDEELVSSLASQAAVAYENTQLIEGIKQLFDSFVQASVVAIEARDPTTSGHSQRVATLTVGLAEAADQIPQGPFSGLRFSRDQIQEVRYASLLHDFGKVGVREKVLVKGKKLYVGELLVIRQRFAYIKRTIENEHLRAKLDQVMAGGATPELLAEMDRTHAEQQAELDKMLQRVVRSNEPALLEEETYNVLLDLPGRSFVDINGQRQPYLTPNELGALSIRRGSLSEDERREIENHVTHTFRFLSQIPWTGEYSRIPEIAYAHHEKLDGTGYPRQLTAKDIPVQSRMMTIADIFDALVAWDRPYKKAVPVERALDILHDETGQGKLDADLLDLFIKARIYDKTVPLAGAEVPLSR